ncbi:MAG: TetR/AcrR family transcriptional regulator [Planctomycetota bacterium]
MTAAAESTTRDRLVEAARELFWDQGYRATGIAQILKKAEARSGSLYHFFPTKEDLLLAVLEKYRVQLRPWLLDPIFQRVTDPIERIFALLDGYRQGLILSDCKQGCPIGNLALEVGSQLPAAREGIEENFRGWSAGVRECLEEASGRLPEGADLERISLFVLTTMEGAVMLARSYQSLEPYDSAVSSLRDYFERLLEDGSTWSAPKPAQKGTRR